MTPLLEVTGLQVRYGGVEALRDVGLSVHAGRVTGLIGPNGAGKTTLLDAVTGFAPLDAGDVCVDGRSIIGMRPHERTAAGVARTFQGLELFDDLTVDDNLLVAAEGVGATAADASRARALAGVRTPGRTVAGSTGPSDRKTVALARALASRPRVLLLDEPAAGLDRGERARLADVVRAVAATGVGVLLVDHDLQLVLDVCDDIVVLDLGTVAFRGTPDQVRADPRVAAAYLGERPASSPATHRSDRSDAPPAIVVTGLRAGYGATTVVDDLDLRVDEGEVVALLGPNGAGKTTTLLTLAGVLRPQAGEIDLLGHPMPRGAHRLARRGVASVLQERKVFADLTVADNLRLAARSRHRVDGAVATLPALEPLLGKRAGALSGGEQQLVAVARAFARRPRLLLVDELSLGLSPTAIDELLRALTAFSTDTGAAVLFAEQHAHHALAVADRGYVLAAGRLVLAGTATELASDPHRLTAAYLGKVAGDGSK